MSKKPTLSKQAIIDAHTMHAEEKNAVAAKRAVEAKKKKAKEEVEETIEE